jgi:branched-subunit amino acid transport protein AzlD
MTILNTHCEHNVAVTVAGELCPAIWFLSHIAALPFLKKKMSLAVLLDLYLYFPNIRPTCAPKEILTFAHFHKVQMHELISF